VAVAAGAIGVVDAVVTRAEVVVEDKIKIS
jgi:hypothetical protein